MAGRSPRRTAMKFHMLFLFLMITLGAHNALADSDAIRTLATIMMELNHYPTDADKAALTAITTADDSSAEEKAIAAAVLAINHQSAAADQPKLSAIVDDEAQPAALRAIARAVRDVNHKIRDADREELAKLTQ
jgi:hypothetical protein